MLSGRGRRVLLLAAGLYLVGWGFGTDLIFPVAVGMALAVLASWVWLRTVVRPMRLRRRTGHHELGEGQPVTVDVELRTDGGPLPGRATLVERMGETRERAVPLARRGHALRGQYTLPALPRGRYVVEGAEVLVSDAFGLAEWRQALPRRDTIMVYPRVYELEGLFTDAGTAGESRQTLLHRQSGYDLHSIRDFQQGESLRRVHWRSTAKRRRLMVKELKESPRDEAAVLLDCDRTAVVEPTVPLELPGTTFDVAVRAAASLLRWLAADGQRSSLLIHDAARTRVRLGTGGNDWLAALGQLAAVRANTGRPLSALLGEVVSGGGGEAFEAARLFIVTATMDPGLADRLRALHTGRRSVAVTWVDAASFAGRRTASEAEGAALLLGRAGIAVARVRAGDHLPSALSASRLAAVAHA